MKRLTLAVGCIAFAFGLTAQAQETTNNDDSSQSEFNRWSIELQGGASKVTRQFAPGYYQNTPDFFSVADLGVRYMLSNRFGLKASVGYHKIKADDNSLDFESRILRGSLEGVINAGNILNFRDFTNRFNLLIHAGGGYSNLSKDAPNEINNDNMLHIMAGLTPQLRISDHIALTADGTIMGNIRQSKTIDGTQKISQRGIDGMLVKATVGITFYLGSAEKHADWYDEQADGLDKRMDDAADRLDKIEKDMLDTDKDGVPDYLDREPNTTSGVTVDTKGIAVDKNGNGIPDELEGALEKGNQNGNGSATSNDDLIKDLINKGYVNVYFKLNSAQPETYSLEAINYLVKYMNEHQETKADLFGYADELGTPEFNEQLSENRAKKVYDILIASGIDKDRMDYKGKGEDDSVDKSSKDARQLVRRVTFKLK